MFLSLETLDCKFQNIQPDFQAKRLDHRSILENLSNASCILLQPSYIPHLLSNIKIKFRSPPLSFNHHTNSYYSSYYGRGGSLKFQLHLKDLSHIHLDCLMFLSDLDSYTSSTTILIALDLPLYYRVDRILFLLDRQCNRQELRDLQYKM